MGGTSKLDSSLLNSRPDIRSLLTSFGTTCTFGFNRNLLIKLLTVQLVRQHDIFGNEYFILTIYEHRLRPLPRDGQQAAMSENAANDQKQHMLLLYALSP